MIMKKLTLLMALMLMSLSGWAQELGTNDADTKYATELVKTGTMAPDFSLKTVQGKRFKLSSLRGKYVVIDFWASWCPDCRRDIPNVLRMYREFHPRGIEFVGVSFDNIADNWKKAIDKYQLEYIQVSELKKMRESAVAQSYGVKWIPSMVLVDPQGKVVLSTVLYYKMERKLSEIARPEQASTDTQELTLQGSVGKLAAKLVRPKTTGKSPLVIVCHGFTGNKDESLLTLISDSLANRGIASLRFDFNGHGQSEGDFVNMTVPNEIEDAKNVVRWARQQDWVSAIAMVGHSQGGVVTSMVAGEMGDTLASVALLAPAAVLRDDAIRGNTMGKTYDPLNPPEYVELYGGHRLGRAYIKSAFSLPIYETAAHYQGPALIVHGTGDRVVPYTYGERYHEQWKDSEFELLPEFDHGFSQNQYRVAQLVSDFFAKTLLSGK
jgi:alpha/beta superfamily hydrolase/peroxiredoxin